MSTLTNDLARLANNANVLVTSITTNSSAITSVNVAGVVINSSGIISNSGFTANGSLGIAGQVLTTNGSGAYWSSAGVNTNASYTWSNAHTFNADVTVNNFFTTGNVEIGNSTSMHKLSVSGTIYHISDTSGAAIYSKNDGSGIGASINSNTGQGLFISSKRLGEASILDARYYSYPVLTAGGNGSSNLFVTVGTPTPEPGYTFTVSGNSYLNGTVNAVSFYAGTTLIGNTTGPYGKTEGSLNVNSALSSNNSSYLGGTDLSTLQGQITSNASAAYTNAVSYTDGKILTANSAITGNAATAYTNATIFASNASNINSGTIAEARLPFRMNQNVTSANDVTFGSLTLTGNLTVSGNVTTIGANNLSIVDNFIYINSNNTTQNIDVGIAANYNSGAYAHTGVFRDASDGIWKVFDSYTPEPDANVNIDTTNTSFHLANFQANVYYAGNTSTNWMVVNTAGIYTTGLVNATSYNVGTSFTANATVVNAVSFYAGTTLIGNTTGPYGKTEGNLNVNSALTSNNSTNLGGTAAASYQLNSTLNANIASYLPTYTGVVNAASHTVGSSFVVNSSTLFIGTTVGVSANGSIGSSGQVLTSNATTVYWASPAATGVTSVGTGNGLSGGPITTTGTVSVLANNGITANSTGLFVTQGTGAVVNSTGVHVNSTYIGTLTANNATYAFGLSSASTTATGSTVVTRDANGDFTGRYINSSYFNSSDDISAGSITYLMGKFGDNYYRSATAAKVATFISGQAMNISGSATNATYATSAGSATNATYATSAGSATNATYATSAGSATNASAATNATYATSAGSATNATTATNLSGGSVAATSGTFSSDLALTTVPFFLNTQTVASNYTVANNYNAHSAGPITINTGVTVTVNTGATWVVL